MKKEYLVTYADLLEEMGVVRFYDYTPTVPIDELDTITRAYFFATAEVVARHMQDTIDGNFYRVQLQRLPLSKDDRLLLCWYTADLRDTYPPTYDLREHALYLYATAIIRSLKRRFLPCNSP